MPNDYKVKKRRRPLTYKPGPKPGYRLDKLECPVCGVDYATNWLARHMRESHTMMPKPTNLIRAYNEGRRSILHPGERDPLGHFGETIDEWADDIDSLLDLLPFAEWFANADLDDGIAEWGRGYKMEGVSIPVNLVLAARKALAALPEHLR